MGLDIGPKSTALFEKEIHLAKSIIWNGPMGVFEFSNFSNGTKQIGEAIAKALLMELTHWSVAVTLLRQ